MAEEKADGKKTTATKKRLVVESLGWLTESSIMPRKHRAISGVGASSIIELKAQLYNSQEEAKKVKDLAGPDVEFLRAKKKIVAHNPLSAKNSGVEARALKSVPFPLDPISIELSLLIGHTKIIISRIFADFFFFFHSIVARQCFSFYLTACKDLKLFLAVK